MAKRTDIELCRIIQAKKPAAKKAEEILYARYHRLIRRLSKKYWLPGFTHADLFQEGCMGFRYSCLSYTGETKLSTHSGWGIMKYCRQHTRRNKITSLIKFNGHERAANEAYNEVPQVQAARKLLISHRLGPRGYNRLLQKIGQHIEVTPDDQVTLSYAFGCGGKRTRKTWRHFLWKKWLEEHISDITARYLASLKRHKQRLRKRQKSRREQLPEQPAGGLGGKCSKGTP